MTPIPNPPGEVWLFNYNQSPSNDAAVVSAGAFHTVDYNHSFSAGKVTYTVTRIDRESGDVYGAYHSGQAYVLDVEDVI